PRLPWRPARRRAPCRRRSPETRARARRGYSSREMCWPRRARAPRPPAAAGNTRRRRQPRARGVSDARPYAIARLRIPLPLLPPHIIPPTIPALKTQETVMFRASRYLLVCVFALVLLPGTWRSRVDAVPSAQAIDASAIDPAILKGFQWRSIGPQRGGRSLTVAGVKGQPKLGYFGATGGGLWKTIDGGETWTPITDGQIHSGSVGAVAVSESNPNVLFIGMGESCIRGNIQPGDGVYKSTDAGKTWTHVGFGASDAISKIRIHPTNPDVVFVADFGKYGAPSDERGLYKSNDGGKTWQRKLFRDNRTGAVDGQIDRRNPNVMFASLWEADRLEDQMSSGGPGSGLFKSIDGGETWSEITRNPGMPQGLVGKITIGISGADSNRIYALVENENGGLFSSDDAGATWKLVNPGRNIRQRAF